MPDVAHDTPPSRPPRARRIAVIVGVALAGLALVLAVARIAAGGPLGRSVVMAALDGRSIGSLGVLDLEGLSGDPLRDLRIARLAIADGDGEWLVVEDARMVWRPGALVHRVVHVERLAAESVRVARRPTVAGGRDRKGDRSWGFVLNALEAPRIELGEPVLGEAAVLAAEARLDADRGGALDARLDLRRTDAPGDVLTAEATREPRGAVRVAAELTAVAEGPLARLLRLPSQTIRATAEVTGEREAGEGSLAATLDGAPFIDASGAWRDGAGSASALARLAAAPELETLRARVGPDVSATLEVEADRGPLPFTLSIASDGLSLTADGAVDLAARALSDGVEIAVRAPRLDALVGPAIADRAALGAAEASGRLTLSDGAAFDGMIVLSDVAYRGWTAAQVGGDIVARYRDGGVDVDAELAAQDADGPAALSAALGDAPTLSAQARYDISDRALDAPRMVLIAAAGEASGEARAVLGGPIVARLDLAITDASTLPRLTAGQAQLQLAAVRQEAGGPIRITATGAAESLAGSASYVADLLGARATLDAAVTLADGGVEIDRASLRGDGLLLEASGSARPESGFDITLDAALEGPVAAGPVEIAGQATAAARIEGAYAAPRLRLDVRAGELSAGPVTLTDPRLRTELASLREGPSGTIVLDAMTEDGPAALTADVAYRDGVFSARTISGGWRGFTVSGEAVRAPESPPVGVLTVRGLEGRLAAELALTLAEGPARLDLHATLRDQPLGESGAVSALNVAVDGPLDALDIAVAARGYAGVDYALEASGRLVRSDGETRLTLTPRGRLGDDVVRAPEPWSATLAGEEAHAAAALEVNGGRLAARLDRQDGRTELIADLSDAPLSTINFLRPDTRLEGHASARVELSGADVLEGRSRVEIVEARAPEYVAEGSLNLTVEVESAADGAEVVLRANGEGGFRARAEGHAPVTIGAWPPLPRIDRDAPVSITGEASGEIAPFWALVGVPVIALEGVVDARGSLGGTLSAPAFEGMAEVSGGRLEEARVGLVLSDIDAIARLAGPRLVVERAEATDGVGGRVSGSGQVEFGGAPGSEAEFRLDLMSLRVVNAAENTAVASGDVTYARDPRGARLGGELTIERADLTPPQRGAGAAAVPTLDVVEINRPEDLAPPPSARRKAMDLDLRVDARRQVFLRSNALDTEWSFDIVIDGDTQEPLLMGTATLVRGSIVVVGERFELERAQITFDGEVKDAKIDFAARHEAADLTVTVRVTGTVEDPQIELESTPSYPQDEILSRMLFGSAKSELSALEAAQLANALASLTGGGGVDILGPLRSTLGIDRLSVGAGEGGARVSGGAYLSEDVYLEVSSSATGLAEATIEWEIRPRLELASSFGLGRESSVSLRWRKDY